MRKLILFVFIILLFSFACSKKEEPKPKPNQVTGVTKSGDDAIMRTRQTEAQTMLRQYYMLQQEHFAVNSVYAGSFDELPDMKTVGNEVAKIYKFEIVTANASELIMTATGNIDRDDSLDKWQINQDGQIENINNDRNN